ncbi:MAG: hypothetical protein HUJ68_04040 [Clostridia bacterium]|nr:hypothetical protein [Clostridia bacterium]
MNLVQQAIAEIAYGAAHAGITMKMKDLSNELKKQGVNPGEKRGLFKQVSTTYDQAMAEGNKGVAKNIADVFTDDNGNHYWE